MNKIIINTVYYRIDQTIVGIFMTPVETINTPPDSGSEGEEGSGRAR